MPGTFDHEKLEVYKRSVEFAAWVYELIAKENLPTVLKNQIERSATSVPLNIAEGNGKTGSRDRSRFFEIARGSALESAANLDVLIASRAISSTTGVDGKEQLIEIVSMLVGLIKATASDRIAEESETGYNPS